MGDCMSKRSNVLHFEARDDMGNHVIPTKTLTKEQLKNLQGKFFIRHGRQIGDSYVCIGYLIKYCSKLEIYEEHHHMIELMEQIYPPRLLINLNTDGVILWIRYQ